jgi:ABC-2 type transport system ATP-binding protein
MIVIDHLTKSYGPKKGVFDLSFSVNKGEVFGFIGPNGAGKTTTIRHLLGFIHPDQGKTSILGLDVYQNSAEIQKHLGYLPGEITFFDHMKAHDFLTFMAEMKGVTDDSKMNHLIDFFDLDTKGRIKKMSKGMKQKLALVVAFMNDPDILILDEPTSGLDPLMQTKFVELILQEKKRGKTILMSSHSFEEIERTCDRAGIIKEGTLVALENIIELKKSQRKIYYVTLKHEKDIPHLTKNGLDIINQNNLEFEIAVSGDLNPFLKHLSQCEIDSLDVKKQSLEEIFMHYYKEDSASE